MNDPDRSKIFPVRTSYKTSKKGKLSWLIIFRMMMIMWIIERRTSWRQRDLSHPNECKKVNHDRIGIESRSFTAGCLGLEFIDELIVNKTAPNAFGNHWVRLQPCVDVNWQGLMLLVDTHVCYWHFSDTGPSRRGVIRPCRPASQRRTASSRSCIGMRHRQSVPCSILELAWRTSNTNETTVEQKRDAKLNHKFIWGRVRVDENNCYRKFCLSIQFCFFCVSSEFNSAFDLLSLDSRVFFASSVFSASIHVLTERPRKFFHRQEFPSLKHSDPNSILVARSALNSDNPWGKFIQPLLRHFKACTWVLLFVFAPGRREQRKMCTLNNHSNEINILCDA